jgi:hypothetical protein
MKYYIVLVGFIFVLTAQSQSYPPFTKWYQNPLGLKPIELHTSNAILIPGIAVGIIKLFDHYKRSSESTDWIGVQIGNTRNYFMEPYNASHFAFSVQFQIAKKIHFGIENNYSLIASQEAFGGGIRPYFLFDFYRNNKFAVSFYSGAGLIFFNQNYPEKAIYFDEIKEGTRLNGSPKYGLRIDTKIFKHAHFGLEIAHAHFSNGNTLGPERNPGYDGNGLFIHLNKTL